jgi:autotransporter-associated beta strand protein
VVDWTGATNTQWNTVTNWSPAAPPTIADDVLFPATIPVTGPNIALGTGETAGSLTFRNAYNLVGGDLTLGDTAKITVAPAVSAMLSTVLSGNAGLSLVANNGLPGLSQQVGGGKLVLAVGNTYSGPTTIASGTLSISANENLGDGSATNTLLMSGGTLQSTEDGIILGPTRTLQISSSGAASGDGATFDVAGTNTLTIDGLIGGAATDVMTKVGTGTLVLTGNNSNSGANNGTEGFSGRIVIKEGFLSVGRKKSGAANIDTTINLGNHSNPIVLDGGGIRWTASGNSSTGRWTMPPTQLWTIGPNGGTIDIVNIFSAKIHFRASSAGGVDQQISGPGTLTKKGIGVLTIENVNDTFTGNWILEDGVLEVRGTGALGSGTNQVIINGGELSNASGGTPTVNTIATALVVNGGAISAENATVSFTGPIRFNNSATVRLGDFYQNIARNLNLNGELSGGGSITVAMGSLGTYVTNAGLFTANTGTLFIKNAANTFSGGITINNNLKLNTASATNSGNTLGTADIVLAGGTLLLKDNGVGNNGMLDYTSTDIFVVAGAGGGATEGIATIDVGRVSANSGNTFRLGALNIEGQRLNVTGANGYALAFTAAGHLGGSSVLDVGSANVTIAAALSGAGAELTKEGAGKLTMNGASSYTGATTVNAGMLAGSGSLAGPLILNASSILAPGDGPGVLGTGGISFNGGRFDLQLINVASFDQLNVTGTVELKAPIDLTLSLSSMAPANTLFEIVQNDGADPVTFADGSSRFVYNGTALNEGTVFTVNNAIVSQTYQISYAGGTGNDIVLRVVPEPSVAYLVLGGIMAAWTRRRSPIS